MAAMKSPVVVSRVFLVLLFGSCRADLEITVIEPPGKTGPDMALIIIPESYINATEYTSLGKALQNEASTFRLWMGFIGGWENQVPNLLEIGTGFERILRRLYELGLAQHAPVMVAGHGYGGGTLSDYVDLNPDMFKALILFSHAPPRYQKMSEFTLPTLFVSGDLDGFMTIFSAANLFQRLVQQSEFAPNLVYDTPVVTLEGLNHTHFFTGPMPVNFTYDDIVGDISYPEAWGNISRYVTAFMVLHAQEPAEEVPTAKALIKSAYEDNQERMGKILAVQNLDQDADGHSPWTEAAQGHLVGLLGKDRSRLKASSDVVSELELPRVKPKATTNGSDVMVETYAEVSPPHGLDKPNASFTPLQLQSKFKTKQVILSMLPNATAQPANLTCRDLNDTALSMASATAQRRFTERGRKLSTRPDIEAKTGEEWLTRQLELLYTDLELYVTSCSLTTPPDFIIQSLAGMHYCKLLAPSRALEWIYVDGLRGTRPG